MKQILFTMLVIVMSGCGGGTPTAPTPVAAPVPVVLACVTNRTGTISLRNDGNRTVDMIWNGAVRGTVNPGQSLPEFTVPASGPQYMFESRITNTSIYPCLHLLATPVQCQINTYQTCRF